MKQLLTKKNFCRACLGKHLVKVFSFGPTPLANAFVTAAKLNEAELFFPLDVYVCNECHFVQLGHVVSPEVLFKNYVYVSSTSSTFVDHFRDYAVGVVRRFKLGRDSLVVDIGSNDGILLKSFKERGMRVLGVEPAQNIAKQANKDGISTMNKFFSPEVVKTMVGECGKASVITANNVFAHIDDLDEVIRAVKILLNDRGVFIVEAPYLVDFFTKNYFDLVYHEHLSYLAVAPLLILFKRLGMEIFDVEKVPVHGGSIRVFAQRANGPYSRTKRVGTFLTREKQAKLDSVTTYQTFEKKVLQNKARLITVLTGLKVQGKSIAGYGAPAKGNTLLNYFGIGTDYIDYIVDDSPFKQGLFTPGKHIPVFAPDILNKENPDFILILAWNFAGPIMAKLKRLRERGIKFIIPVPRPKIF